MELRALPNRQRGGYTTFGAVWEKGEVRTPSFTMRNASGETVPVQSEVAAVWPDGSVKWSSHTADSDRMGDSVTLLPVSAEKTACKAGEEDLGACTKTSESEQLKIEEKANHYEIDLGEMSLNVPKAAEPYGSVLAGGIRVEGKLLAESIYPVFWLQRPADGEGDRATGSARTGKEDGSVPDAVGMPVSPVHAKRTCQVQEEFFGQITSVAIERSGPLQAVFCFRGNHVTGKECAMPFVIRMYLGLHSTEIRFVHTFLYDGVEDRDYLKGMGIRCRVSAEGAKYDRHIRFAADGAPFHEAAVHLRSRIPGLPESLFARQMSGEWIEPSEDADIRTALNELPIWNRYALWQRSAYSYEIRKQTDEDCCALTCATGGRNPGAMDIQFPGGRVTFGIRDFWQKYPSGLEVDGLAEDTPECTMWFYSPEAPAYDFRHYSKASYPRTSYEGFDYVGASAYGIGVTSEGRISFERPETFVASDRLERFAKQVQKPPVYVGTPEYYHAKRAFGYWSLPERKNPAETWLEDQLEKAFDFYKQEIENRKWYGLFDYGDIMHTYDPVRHVWRYDIGGFAWQNTELVPTYWLWLYFLRTGREDVFSLAEAMSRHCSEVDIYHFGEHKGLGSRHNVRHWGCSCKEPRVAMAGHHRFLRYLTGDLRLKDMFEDVKDADDAMSKSEQFMTTDKNGERRFGIRSGPDWSSLVSNWMTWHEMTGDERYLDKIRQGVRDIAATPFGFASGPDFFYEKETAHLIYRGENEDTPNQHLQICMGGPQIWLETADVLGDDTLKQLLVRLGAFYYLPPKIKSQLTGGKISKRDFNWPMLASGIAALSAKERRDEELGRQAWRILLEEITGKGGMDGFAPECYLDDKHRMLYAERIKEFQEIPWNTTNSASQWCLNVIMCLEFGRDYLGETIEECLKEV